MTIDIKNLLDQAQNSEIPWNTKIKLDCKVRAKKPLQKVALENWKKIRSIYPWWRGNDENDFLKQLERNNKLIRNSDQKFASEPILQDFKNHVNTNRTLNTKNSGRIKVKDLEIDDVIISDWNEIVDVLRQSFKIFGRDSDTAAYQSEESLRFLQAIVDENILHTIEYQDEEEFELIEWKDAENIEVEKKIKAQSLLNEKYPDKKERNLKKKLVIRDKSLEGDLDLRDFVSLEYLNCENNYLTSLDIRGLVNLKEIYCGNNRLTSENFYIDNLINVEYFSCRRNSLSNLDSLLNYLNPEKLVSLRLLSNNFTADDLNCFSKFVNLNNLGIGNYLDSNNLSKEVARNIFSGSLKPLKDLKKLKKLSINDTLIEKDWEYLPDGLEGLSCEKTKLQEDWEYFGGSLKKIKEFNDSAYKWLEEKYPRNGKCTRTDDGENKGKKREDVTILEINNQELKGGLRLKNFTNLKYLICSRNQITDLDLTDCKNLENIDCNDNQLRSLNFLSQSTNLKELDISDCPTKGTLKSLSNFSQLETLRINNTNIEEGLEYLPLSCQKLYCNSGYESKSIKIVKELDRSKCSEEDEYENRYYNLNKWREDKQNRAIVAVIPLERFFVIRSNIKKFISKWGIKEEKNDNSQWYEKYLNPVPKETNQNKLSELNKLHSPEQFNKHWYWTIPQWGGRGMVGVGGALSFFFDYKVSAITVASPIIETITSYAKSRWYSSKEKQWGEFTQDIKELLDNYHELLGILKTIEVNQLEGLNKVLQNLNQATQDFLKEHDNDNNGTIDIFELQKNKQKLANDLDKENKLLGASKLERIVVLMKLLEKGINDYNQGKLDDKITLNEQKRKLIWFIIDLLANCELEEKDCLENNWIEQFEKSQEKDFVNIRNNLLCNLIKAVAKKLEQLINQEESSKVKNFIETVEYLCKAGQKIENEELNNLLFSFKNKVTSFYKRLNGINSSIKEDSSEIVIDINKEQIKLVEIIAFIRDLEEKMKVNRVSLDEQARETKETEAQIVELDIARLN